MKRLFTTFCLAFLLAACESNENFWTAETCNDRLEADIEDFENHRENFQKAKTQMDTDARSGNTVSAEANKKSAESWKESTRSLLKFVDSNIAPVCEGKFRQDLLAKVDDARTFANDDTAVKLADAEGMPDVRVSAIESTFVPFEIDERGQCSGPYLNLVFTVSNYGGDFPRPVDLQTYTERAQRTADELPFLAMTGELDFGGDMRKRVDLEVTGANGGRLPSGASLKMPAKIKVDYNQTHARAKGSVAGMAFLKTGSTAAAPYETEIDIPLWDIYTESHMVIQSKGEDGKSYIGAKATVSNRGASPTPGPIEGSFIIKDLEANRQVTSWSGKTDGPVSGTADIYAKIPHDGKLPAKISVYSSIIPLCPDGKAGGLADGDTKNNIRTLEQR